MAAGEVVLPPGYLLEPVAQGLTAPVALAFDDQGRLHLLEAGEQSRERVVQPRLLRVESGGQLTEVARGAEAPWTGLSYHQGAFLVREAGRRLVRVDPSSGATTTLAEIPGLGVLPGSGPLAAPDGDLWLGVGPVVSADLSPGDATWLSRHLGRGGAICQDGTPHPRPCGGVLMRLTPGEAPRVAMRGLRHPLGTTGGPDGVLYLVDSDLGPDGKGGSGQGDLLLALTPGAEASRRTVARLGPHSWSSGLELSPGGPFGLAGTLLVAQAGDLTHPCKRRRPAPGRVVQVNPASGVVMEFAVNQRGATHGLQHPVALRFDPSGEALYVADLGLLVPSSQGPRVQEQTGVLWRIRKAAR